MPDVLTVREVADLLRVHRCTIYRLLRKGELPAFKLGADWRFLRDEVELWTKLRSEAPTEVSMAGTNTRLTN
jgi:excisionase family DNA binding protein